jgi:hypothetical protein
LFLRLSPRREETERNGRKQLTLIGVHEIPVMQQAVGKWVSVPIPHLPIELVQPTLDRQRGELKGEADVGSPDG